MQQRIVEELRGYLQIVDSAKKIVQSYRPIIPKSFSAECKSLDEIAMFKPSKDEVRNLPEDTKVSFVPMADISMNSEFFEAKEERQISEVLSGFTYFRDNDILLAKITPCFENGKAGIARGLTNGVGFGSTEYIVIRANTDIVYPEWIYYHINSTDFLAEGKKYMTGTAGQQRIDINYVKQYSIPVPSLEMQKEVLDKIKNEQELVKPAKDMIVVFTEKINDRIKDIWEE
jgi:hypothetical protein